jgi:hypothetical protein
MRPTDAQDPGPESYVVGSPVFTPRPADCQSAAGCHPNATYFAKADHRHHLVGRTPSSAAGPLAGSSMIAGA